jgi:hypothetical protein
MNSSLEARGFTETLLSAVRLQRHLGVRMIISTQEPTVSTTLLNLCSTTIVHRFTSPEWLRILHKHLAGALESPFGGSNTDNHDTEAVSQLSLFEEIVNLQVGEAILFSPVWLLKQAPATATGRPHYVASDMAISGLEFGSGLHLTVERVFSQGDIRDNAIIHNDDSDFCAILTFCSARQQQIVQSGNREARRIMIMSTSLHFVLILNSNYSLIRPKRYRTVYTLWQTLFPLQEITRLARTHTE